MEHAETATEETRPKYDTVNSKWPDQLPLLEGEESIAAAKRLYRFAMKKRWRGKWALTSGNRFTWPRRGTFYVNPKGNHFGGWRDLVHCLSHYCHRELLPHRKPHDPRHEYLERDMVAYVIANDWLSGKLKSKAKAKPPIQDVRKARVEAGIKRWETKLKRASNALKKLRKQKARYDRLTTH